MSPFTLFLYAVAISSGILIVGLAAIVVIGVLFYVLGGVPPKERSKS